MDVKVLWLQSMIDALRFTAGYAEEHVLHFIGVESSYLAEKISMPLIKILCTSVIHIIPKGIFKLFARKEICFLLFKFSKHNFSFTLISILLSWTKYGSYPITRIITGCNLCIETVSSTLLNWTILQNVKTQDMDVNFVLSIISRKSYFDSKWKRKFEDISLTPIFV